ncbi:hydrogenase maturation protease [Amycolatopsis taiwanensis]|uniref:hydrogenase maturation protease n=1 Tax=Amycolatopsis taiwanensis TaxID=342230 RepID=UPI0004BA7CB2|nr:hydrogenase maturation protease [Amycolatopsis taiwanensis]
MSRPGAGVLIAGIGNVLLGDDGFGVEVARRLADLPLPPGVVVGEYGIRGMHLAYELLDGQFGGLILVDAVPLDDPPGTVAVLDVAPDDARIPGTVDAHGMDPVTVLGLLRRLGGTVGRVRVVGCRPAVLEERLGLSDVVRAAVEPAARLTLDLAADLAGKANEYRPEHTVGRRNRR